MYNSIINTEKNKLGFHPTSILDIYVFVL